MYVTSLHQIVTGKLHLVINSYIVKTTIKQIVEQRQRILKRYTLQKQNNIIQVKIM